MLLLRLLRPHTDIPMYIYPTPKVVLFLLDPFLNPPSFIDHSAAVTMFVLDAFLTPPSFNRSFHLRNSMLIWSNSTLKTLVQSKYSTNLSNTKLFSMY